MRVKMICSKNLLCFVFAFLSLEELRAFFLSNSEWRIQFLFSSWSISCIPPKLYFHRLDKERGLISQTVDGNRALNLSLIWAIKGCKLRSISLKYINFKVFTIAFFAFFIFSISYPRGKFPSVSCSVSQDIFLRHSVSVMFLPVTVPTHISCPSR